MPPLILAYILGSKIEEYLRKGLTYSNEGMIMFFKRPVSLILLLIALFSVVIPIVKPLVSKKPAKEIIADD